LKAVQISGKSPQKQSQPRKEGGKSMAGLGASNQVHGFLFHNGDKSKGKIFANLLNHGVRQPPEIRKKLEFYLN